jgi:hypothetical protein
MTPETLQPDHDAAAAFDGWPEPSVDVRRLLERPPVWSFPQHGDDGDPGAA